MGHLRDNMVSDGDTATFGLRGVRVACSAVAAAVTISQRIYVARARCGHMITLGLNTPRIHTPCRLFLTLLVAALTWVELPPSKLKWGKVMRARFPASFTPASTTTITTLTAATTTTTTTTVPLP